MKRVLIFSLAYYPYVGGAEVAVKELTDRMPDIEFHMVTLRWSSHDAREERIGNVFVHRIGPVGSSKLHKFLFQLFASRAGAALHRKQHFDAIWALMAHSAGVPAALFKKKFPDIPYILHLQEGDPPERIERQMRLLWPFFTRAFTQATVVQAISNFLGQWARRRGFTGPLEIIPNGVDVQKFVGEKIVHEDVVLITTSRLVRKNALDDVIRALPLLPAEVRFTILGTGPEMVALRALAKKIGMESRVEFVGYVEHKTMPAYLHAADIFVRPSRSEGQGASFIEAMAAGLPIVATQVGGITDFLFDAQRNPSKPTTGWAVDVDSPEQIAAQIKAILSNPAGVARVIDTAKELASTQYDWSLLAKNMRERVFGKVL